MRLFDGLQMFPYEGYPLTSQKEMTSSRIARAPACDLKRTSPRQNNRQDLKEQAAKCNAALLVLSIKWTKVQV